MRIIYSAFLFLYETIIRIAAVLGNPKARLWIDGRKNWAHRLKESLSGKNNKRIWFHCASLGEFEQGRPLIEAIKKESPGYCIVLSFFSPSGYEIRKNYPLADVVCYLPIDSRLNARHFIEIVSPSQVVFIKYEFWFNYFDELGRKGIPLYIVSAIFRPGQIFFKSSGGFFRRGLKNVKHFFVQDKQSSDLLGKIGFDNVTISGDTRFDRVYGITIEKKSLDLLDKFKNGRRLIIAGSTWREDEEMLIESMKEIGMKNTAVVIAPHEVNQTRTSEIKQLINRYFPAADITRFTDGKSNGTEDFFILDTIGHLSSAYSYGTIAWIGGGFGKGIHNLLEAAAFGNPVLFGPKYEKFKEAHDLIKLKGAFPVMNKTGAAQILSRLLDDTVYYTSASKASADYVLTNRGATDIILGKTGLTS